MKIDLTHILQDVLKDHKLWLRGVVGSRADLQGADLQGADLQGADLRSAYLQGADLQGADLRSANLQGADLQGADLRSAYLQGADLRSAYLRSAYLQGADLQGADLRSANLQGANLQGAALQNTIYENDVPIIINTEFYLIVKTKAYIKIGCQTHSPEKWAEFTKTEIAAMDSNATKFWNKYKQLILMEIK